VSSLAQRRRDGRHSVVAPESFLSGYSKDLIWDDGLWNRNRFYPFSYDTSQMILIQTVLLFLINERILKSSRLSSSRYRFPYHSNLKLKNKE